MSEPTDSASERSERFQALIGAYLDAVQSGRPVDREAWLAAHPDLAGDLRAFLADYDQFQELAAPLRDVAGAAAGAAATVSHESAGLSIGSGASPDVTFEGGDSAAPPAAGTRVRYFGDYELVRTLGEGGMGIVFEARQRSLDRIVALKMIRAGRFAGDDDLRRFRNEAEAVAKLDHPHIVPVYEVGEHEGHNYFSMKRIDGTSLAANLSGYRDRPREAARLVAAVAKALHHAHQRGVLHRDLKPSNILLDAKGEPHLTDFGLAKRLEGPGAAETTRTGAILGTPAYMAPEQASGRRGEVTTATDVYGLGALLYALLTGHAPFRGESVADTLLQVRERSPEPIRRSNAMVPRDLETICRRCLEREPRRRYASADAVAEELERWLRGEPITARPVGTLERGWMWCRRNPVVAGLIGAVAVALIMGTAVSTVFAVRASNRARAERIERIRAENAEKDTRKARGEIEGTFARSLLRPLDPAGDAKDALAPTEVESLWELAGYGSESLRLRLLDEATRSPMTTRQLCARSEPALIAAVGLDLRKREQALELLNERLGETGLPLAQKADIALTALELTDRGGSETGACEEALAGAIKADLPAHLPAAWTEHLSRNVARLEPDRAGRLIRLTLEEKPSPSERERLALALAMSSPLEPAKADRVCDEVLRRLIDTLVRETDRRRGIPPEFDALSRRMPRGEAIRRLAEAMDRVIDSGARQRLAVHLGAVIRAIPREDVPEIRPATARSLADALGRETIPWAREDLALALANLTKSWQQPKSSEVMPVVQSLATALRAQKDPERRGHLAWALAPLAELLGPEESTRICLSAAESLSSDWTKTKKIDSDQEWWIRGIGAMVIRLPPDLAARTAHLIATVAPPAGHGAMNLYYLLAGLDADDAARTARVLVAALRQDTDPETRWWLAAGLCLVAKNKDPIEAARVCGPAVVEMGKAVATRKASEQNEYNQFLIDGFVVVASRQEPAVAGSSARVLADLIKKNSFLDVRRLATGLTTVAGRMEPAESARVCGEAARALADSSGREPSGNFGIALAALAGRMERIEAERICGEAARDFCNALSGDKDTDQAWTAAGLAAVAKGLNPVEAARVLSEALRGEMDADACRRLVEGLSATTARMEPPAAAQICDRTIRSLLRSRSAKPRAAEDRRGFDSSVAELLPRLEARKANAQAALLAAMMCSESKGVEFDGEPAERILSRLLTDTSQTQRELRAVRIAMATIGPGVGSLIAAVSLAAEPWPCRLTTQELVDLLKMPTCFGKARRVVLDHLGNIHGRRFANHWEFVHFTHENHLSLDVTSPPRRPDPASLGAE